jgi:two-component system response regulator YesN
MKEELGITRIPNQVLAVMPLVPGTGKGGATDPAEALVLQDKVQRACRQLAKTLPETVMGGLGDYGALFLTSTDPAKNAVQARLWVRDMAQGIQNAIRKKFGLRSVVGVGRPLPVGSVLAPSLREAVVALHLCVQRGIDLQFYERLENQGEEGTFGTLHRSEREMLSAFERDAWEDLRAGSERFSREVLEYAGGDLTLLQALFLSALYRLLDRAGARWALEPEEGDPLRRRFAQGMAEAGSIHRSIGVFTGALGELRNLSLKPREGAQSLRIEKALTFLNEHFGEPLTLSQTAKRTGFSVPLFCRVFKKRTGQTFSVYLNRLRVEEAKRLLRGSGLALGQVGRTCGFRSAHHFIRNFKKVVGKTPGDFRTLSR